MLKNKFPQKRALVILAGTILVLAACSIPSASPSPTPAPSPIPVTATAVLPSPTPPPMAVNVNGEGIYLEDYQAELKRYEKALTDSAQTPSEGDQKMVLDNLIAETLLAQNAVKDGYQLDDAGFKSKLDELTQKAGGADSMAAWLNENFYSQESFERILKRQMAAAWERNRIIDAVPTSTEQAHARQILVSDEALANQIFAQLQAGTKFEDLAVKYDPQVGGEMGWFPRGVLFLPEVEKAVFALQPGQYSEVIKTSYGFHIVQLIELSPQLPLASDSRRVLQHALINSWMQDQLAKSSIEILIK